MKTIQTYAFSELSEDAQERVRRNWEDSQSRECFWGDEIRNSLNAAQDAFTLPDENDDEDMTTGRRLAWLENRFMGRYRIPFAPISKSKQRRDYARWGTYYTPGRIAPCPFTGYCFDETLIASVYDAVKRGYTLHQAYDWMAYEAEKEWEREMDHQVSEEAFREWLESDEPQFLEDGRMI